MGTSAEIGIVVRWKESGAAAGAGRLVGELDKADAAQKKFAESTKKSAGALDGFKDAIAKIGVAFAALKTFKVVAELYELGGAAQRARYSLDVLTGGRADEYVKALDTALNGTVSRLDAMRISSQLLAFGIADSSEQVAKFTRAAAILGGTFKGLGAAEAANEFALLMSNMSYLRLDSFGIASGKVRARVAELKAETKGLTTEMAFFQAVMEQAGPLAEALSGVLSDSAAEGDKLKAEFADLKVALGELVAQGLTPAIAATNDLIEGMKSLSAAEREQIQRTLDMAQSGQDFVNMMEYQHYFIKVALMDQYELAKRTGQTTKSYQEWQKELWATNHALAMQTAYAPATADAVAEAAAAVADATDAYAANGAGLEFLQKHQEAMAKAYQEAARQAREYLGWQQALTDAALGTTDALTLLGTSGFANSTQAGEIFFGLLKDSGNDVLLAGQAYTDLALKFGMITSEQAKMASGFQLIMDALSASAIDINVAADLFEGFASGAIVGVSELQAQLDSLDPTRINAAMQAAIMAGDIDIADTPLANMGDVIDNVGQQLDIVAAKAPTAFQSIADNAPPATEAVSAIAERLNSASGSLISITGRASSAGDAMASAMTDALPAISEVAGHLNTAKQAWAYLASKPKLTLKAIIEVVQGTGGASGSTTPGGAFFITDGPMTLTVGDPPGGRELVLVKPLSGKGTSTKVPGGGISMAGGGMAVPSGIGALGGGPIYITVNTIATDGATLVREVENELRRRGRSLYRGVV